MSSTHHLTRPENPTVPQAKQRPSRKRKGSPRPARRRRNAWLLFALALIGVIATVALTNSSLLKTPAKVPAHTRPFTTSAPMARGNFHEYALPLPDMQVMRPAIDHEGRIWFGEMGYNALGVFDPHTHTFRQIATPHGRFGLMGLQVAADDTIWFVETYANYLGHYFPTTGYFQIYPLPWLNVPDPAHANHTQSLPVAPNELAIDARGNVWFTELNADALGRLDTHTGHFQIYPLSAKKSTQALDPYGITIDSQGMIWFTEAGNKHIGRLDPSTGTIQYFTFPEAGIQLMEIASSPDGTIWATSFEPGLLLSLDPRTGNFTAYHTPFTTANKSSLFGLLITSSGEVWVTVSAENAIARLDVAASRFIYYPIPTKASLPLGLVMGTDRSIWFTETDKIGMLQPS